MTEIFFNHPGFKAEEAVSRLIEMDNNKVVRIEFPDGVIAQFITTPDGLTTVQSNRSYIIDQEIDGIMEVRPNLYDINNDFVDILTQIQ